MTIILTVMMTKHDEDGDDDDGGDKHSNGGDGGEDDGSPYTIYRLPAASFWAANSIVEKKKQIFGFPINPDFPNSVCSWDEVKG